VNLEFGITEAEHRAPESNIVNLEFGTTEAEHSVPESNIVNLESESSDESEDSERNSDSESSNESEDSNINAHNFTIQKLYEQLQGGFHGCSIEQHEEKLQEHIEQAGENHYGLGDVFNDENFPSVLPIPELVSADRFRHQPTPTPAQWQAMYCGIPIQQPQTPQPGQPAQRPRPMNVCMHKEETLSVEPQVAFDIDSFLGFASSLAMARQGLFYQPAAQMRQNMSTDVHIETRVFEDNSDVEQPSRSHLAMLKDIPHFLLGRVVGAQEITVYILFPHLSIIGSKFSSLTNDQLSRWLNRIFNPAVHRYCEAHYTQHIPASYRQALANSKANQIEGRQVETASYQAQQSLGYHLQPEYLDQIWTEIINIINDTPGVADFREPQLFISAKGTKLQFKTSPSRPTILDAMENFHSYLDRIIDLDFIYLDRFYVDVGKEICSPVSLLRGQIQQSDEEAQVYSWKRCCLKHYIHWMYDGTPPAITANGQRYYDQNMLYDACSLTSITPKRSKLREGGLIYSQFYGSVKEISDASKCFPFDNDGLEELALDPQIRQGARNAAGGNRRDANILERAYCASKVRTRIALQDSKKKSFGIREEHRMSWSLFQGLIGQLRLEDPDELEIVLTECPTYVWPVKTEVYFNYLWRCADKFATGFEIILARSRRELVTWEQTKMMAMFLRCLRFVFGGHRLERESALWWSRRERSVGQPPIQRIWYGLGFCNTLPRYKYCWLEPRFDWNQLTFRSNITDQVLFGNGMLRGQYLRRGGQVQDFFDASRQLDLALEWIGKYHEHTHIRDRLLSWMAYICLHQFRQDILQSVKGEISEEHRSKALEKVKPLCFEYLEDIMADRLHLVSGNRSDYKQVADLGHFLFDFDDGRIRTHWEDRPYRKLYRRGRVGLDRQHSQLQLGSRFSRMLFRKLYAHHWILPYPTIDVFMQTTKQGQRMWYSINTTRIAGRQNEEVTGLHQIPPEDWFWARKTWRQGQPKKIPYYTKWDKEKWINWMERQPPVVITPAAITPAQGE
jgi:hypothetical protein